MRVKLWSFVATVLMLSWVFTACSSSCRSGEVPLRPDDLRAAELPAWRPVPAAEGRFWQPTETSQDPGRIRWLFHTQTGEQAFSNLAVSVAARGSCARAEAQKGYEKLPNVLFSLRPDEDIFPAEGYRSTEADSQLLVCGEGSPGSCSFWMYRGAFGPYLLVVMVDGVDGVDVDVFSEIAGGVVDRLLPLLGNGG